MSEDNGYPEDIGQDKNDNSDIDRSDGAGDECVHHDSERGNNEEKGQI